MPTPSSPLVLVRLRAPQRVDGAASVVVGAKDETEAEMATALPQVLQLGLHVRRQVNRRRHWAEVLNSLPEETDILNRFYKTNFLHIVLRARMLPHYSR